MKKVAFSLAGLVLAAGAAHAQSSTAPVGDPHGSAHAGAASAVPAEPAVPADPSAGAPEQGALPAAPATPAEPAIPAEPAAPLAVANVTEAEIDSFAQATVKLQEIQADASIAAEQKQEAMQAAVAEAGLDPAKYNAIGKATQTDPALRAKVQTAMSRYASTPPSDG